MARPSSACGVRMQQLKENEIILRHNHENTGVGGEPFVYNLETGVVSVGETGEIDGSEFVHFANKLSRMRIRAGLDPDPNKAEQSFVGTHMGSLELDKAQLDLAWRNLVNRYPESQRELVADRVAAAREVLEGTT